MQTRQKIAADVDCAKDMIDVFMTVDRVKREPEHCFRVLNDEFRSCATAASAASIFRFYTEMRTKLPSSIMPLMEQRAMEFAQIPIQTPHTMWECVAARVWAGDDPVRKHVVSNRVCRMVRPLPTQEFKFRPAPAYIRKIWYASAITNHGNGR